MSDMFSKAKRSWIMSRIRARNTEPELRVRRLLHGNGYRFRLHRKDLPGNPDIVLPKYRTAIFVHGCFWHRHPKCKFSYMPKSRIDFWRRKFSKNIERDRKAQRLLRDSGWHIVIVWECEKSDPARLHKRLRQEIGSSEAGFESAGA